MREFDRNEIFEPDGVKLSENIPCALFRLTVVKCGLDEVTYGLLVDQYISKKLEESPEGGLDWKRVRQHGNNLNSDSRKRKLTWIRYLEIMEMLRLYDFELKFTLYWEDEVELFTSKRFKLDDGGVDEYLPYLTEIYHDVRNLRAVTEDEERDLLTEYIKLPSSASGDVSFARSNLKSRFASDKMTWRTFLSVLHTYKVNKIMCEKTIYIGGREVNFSFNVNL